ncbi:MAG: LysM peptidoglycan-binding domain-containing protein [Chthoniobacterales bacterium]
MKTSKILILLGVALLVFGSAAFCGYELFLKPYGIGYNSHRFFHKKTETPTIVAPAPDPSLAAFDAAVALQNLGKLMEAQTSWQTWLQAYPDSSKRSAAMAALGKINMELLCSASSTANKDCYTVIKGDSLARIASRQKSSAELIQHVNRLPNINLQIGELLLIPRLQISIDIDRNAHLLTLLDHDQFLKNYTLLSTPDTGPSKTPITTNIVDKTAMVGGKRAAFGDKKYLESERTIILRSSGNIVTAPATMRAASSSAITSTNAEASSTSASQGMPSGYVLSATDINEIFPFVGKETPVTIH